MIWRASYPAVLPGRNLSFSLLGIETGVAPFIQVPRSAVEIYLSPY